MGFFKIIFLLLVLTIGNLQAIEKDHYSSFDTCEKILGEALNKKSFSFISKLNFIDVCEFEFDTHNTNPITYAAMAKYYDKTNYDLFWNYKINDLKNPSIVFELIKNIYSLNKNDENIAWALANLYYWGIGTKIDYFKSSELMNSISNSKNAQIINDFALIHMYGDGVNKNEKKAIDILTQYVKKHKGTKGIYHTLATIYRDRQNEDAEKKYLKLCINTEPIKRIDEYDHFSCKNDLTIIEDGYSAVNWKEPVLKLIKKFPNNSELHYFYEEEFLDKNKDPSKIFEKTIKIALKNNNVSVLNYIIEDIITTFENKDIDSELILSLTDYILKITPDNHETFYNLGYLHHYSEKVKNFEKAIKYYNKSFALKVNSKSARRLCILYAGFTEETMYLYDQRTAIDYCMLAIGADRTNMASRYALSRIYSTYPVINSSLIKKNFINRPNLSVELLIDNLSFDLSSWFAFSSALEVVDLLEYIYAGEELKFNEVLNEDETLKIFSAIEYGLENFDLEEVDIKEANRILKKYKSNNQEYNYYALLIGNSDYKNMEKLKTPIKDINNIGKVLTKKYGFQVNYLSNASRKDILKTINEYIIRLNENDNFLIYYAGHGYYDETLDQNYWLPIEADKEDDSEWIPTDRVNKYFKAFKSKNILAIVDSCYGGNILRGVQVKENKNELYEIMQKKQSRIAITSGGNSPVLDDGGNNRSIFSEELEKALETSKDAIDSASLFTMINKNVTKRSIKLGVKQIPQRAIIPNSNHEGGDFVLIAK